MMVRVRVSSLILILGTAIIVAVIGGCVGLFVYNSVSTWWTK